MTSRRITSSNVPLCCTCDIQDNKRVFTSADVHSPRRREMKFLRSHTTDSNNHVGDDVHRRLISNKVLHTIYRDRGQGQRTGTLDDVLDDVPLHALAVNHRHTLLLDVRKQVSTLEKELEVERKKWAHMQTIQKEREAVISRLKEHNDNLKRQVVATDRKLNDAKNEINILLHKYNDLYTLLKEKDKSTQGLLEKHHSETKMLSMKREASTQKGINDIATTKDHYNALILAKRDLEDLNERLEQRDGVRETTAEAAGVLAEALRLQRFNTQRLLDVFLYIGSIAENAMAAIRATQKLCIKTLSKLSKKMDKIATLCSSVQYMGRGAYQYIAPSLTHAGKTNFTDAIALQDLCDVVTYYTDSGSVEDNNGAIQASQGVNKSLDGVGFASYPYPVFRSLYVDADHWIPAECVALTQLFREQHFPNSRPDIFYAFMLRIATILKDLCGIGPLNKLLRNTEHKKALGQIRYGSKHSRPNAGASIINEALIT